MFRAPVGLLPSSAGWWLSYSLPTCRAWLSPAEQARWACGSCGEGSPGSGRARVCLQSCSFLTPLSLRTSSLAWTPRPLGEEGICSGMKFCSLQSGQGGQGPDG